jgi:hypothetical protein
LVEKELDSLLEFPVFAGMYVTRYFQEVEIALIHDLKASGALVVSTGKPRSIPELLLRKMIYN